jgi:hypothetical protein
MKKFEPVSQPIEQASERTQKQTIADFKEQGQRVGGK